MDAVAMLLIIDAVVLILATLALTYFLLRDMFKLKHKKK